MKIPKGITVRFTLAVIAGLATSMALSMTTRLILYLCGLFPVPFKPLFETNLVIIALVYHSIFAMTGAFVTAHVARDPARKAVIFMGSKEAIMWLLGTIFLWKHALVLVYHHQSGHRNSHCPVRRLVISTLCNQNAQGNFKRYVHAPQVCVEADNH